MTVKNTQMTVAPEWVHPCFIFGAGTAIIGGTGEHAPQHCGWGDAKVNVPPLIAHLVKFLGHIFHLDKLDYCISGVSVHCFPNI